MKSQSLILPALAALLAASLTALAVPVSTAFNYQGRLDHNGAVANGLFDLKFEIYTEWTGGTPAVPAIEVQGLAVSGGLISADLDFGGATVFDGRAYYLQTYARQQGAPTYVLVPGGRTAIRPAPYSIHALSAASVKDGSVTSASLAAGSVTSAKLAPSAVGLPQLNVVVPPLSGQVLTYNGAGLSWLSPTAGPWLLSGADAFYNGGNVGIGTTTPGRKLTVFHSGYGIEQTDGTVRLGTYTAASHNAGFIGTQSDHKLHLEVNGSPRLTVATNGNVGIGTSTPASKLEVAGNISATGDITVTGLASVRTLTIRGGADLAEPFAMSHHGVEPGTVVVIDAANPGKLKASTRAYDKKVAGIVSGANGIQPGISMIQEDKLEAGENVALSGRVFVKADTSAGPIEPGDLLTTSSIAGRAMKAADHTQAQGAILGKAMTPLQDGDGMVLVLVTLQ